MLFCVHLWWKLQLMLKNAYVDKSKNNKCYEHQFYAVFFSFDIQRSMFDVRS